MLLKGTRNINTQENQMFKYKQRMGFILLQLVENTFWVLLDDSSGDSFKNLPFSSCISYLLLCNKPFPNLMMSNDYNHVIIQHYFQGSGVQEASARLTASGSTKWSSADSSWAGTVEDSGYINTSASLEPGSEPLLWSPRRLAWTSSQLSGL